MDAPVNGIESFHQSELERLKDLTYLYSLSELLYSSTLSIQEGCEQVVHLIPSRWPDNQEVGASIQIDQIYYQTPNFRETSKFQRNKPHAPRNHPDTWKRSR